jgi:hypothetical protein
MGTIGSRLIASTRTADLWDVAVVKPEQGYAFATAPLIVKALSSARRRYGIRGFMGVDAKTRSGASDSGPGGPAESWTGDAWRPAAVRVGHRLYDPDLGNAGYRQSRLNGDNREGANLYSCSHRARR